jgi:hypothetical protein
VLLLLPLLTVSPPFPPDSLLLLRTLAPQGIGGITGTLLTGLFANVDYGAPVNGAFYWNAPQVSGARQREAARGCVLLLLRPAGAVGV